MGEMEDVDRATSLFGCRIGKFPTSYLGLPLGAPHRHCDVWDSIEERFKRKLSTWKKQYPSKGWWLVLIKSTLSNLPIYSMSLFAIPRKVRIRLARIQKDFVGRFGRKEKDPFGKLFGCVQGWKIWRVRNKVGGSQSSLARKMVMEVFFWVRELMEEDHFWKIWGYGGGMDY